MNEEATVPHLTKGYYTDENGTVTEYEMFKGDLNDAVERFPGQWSKTPPKPKATTKAK